MFKKRIKTADDIIGGFVSAIDQLHASEDAFTKKAADHDMEISVQTALKESAIAHATRSAKFAKKLDALFGED